MSSKSQHSKDNGPLPSKKASSWIKNKRDMDSRLLGDYLLGCPSFGCSAQGKSIPALGAANVEGCREIISQLCLSVFLCPVDNASALAKRLRKDGKASDALPHGRAEFAYYVLTPSILHSYGLCTEIEKEKLYNKGVWNPYRSLLEVDCFFRHIRNSLAHGSFVKTRRKVPQTSRMDTYWFFQDSNSSGNVTARMFLRNGSLEKISKLMN